MNSFINKTRLAYYAIFGLISFQLSIVLWASNKGLDLTDESFYLLSFFYPENSDYSFTKFYLIFHKIFFLYNSSIQTLRIFLSILVCLSSVFYSSCLFNLLQKKEMIGNIKRLFFNAFVLSFSLMCFCFGPLTPSYNTLNTVLLNFYAGTIILLLTSIEKDNQLKNYSLYSFIFLISMLWFLLLINKPTTALFILFPTSIIIIHTSRIHNKSIQHYLKLILVALISLVFITVICFGNLNGFFVYIFNFKEMLKYMPNVYKEGLLPNIINDFKFTLSTLGFLSNAVTIVITTFLFFANSKYIRAILFSLLILNFYYILQLDILNDVYSKFFLCFDIISVSFLYLIFNKKIEKRTKITLLFLSIFPVIGYFGSNVSYTVQQCFYATFGASLFLVFISNTNFKNQKIAFTLIIIFNSIITFSSIIKNPYRQADLNLCNKKITINKNQILVPKNIAEFNKDLNYLVHKNGCKKLGYIFTLSNYYSSCLLLNKPLPYNAWLQNETPSLNLYFFEKMSEKQKQNCLYLFPPSYNYNSLLINSKGKFTYKDQIKYPSFQNLNDTVNIFTYN